MTFLTASPCALSVDAPCNGSGYISHLSLGDGLLRRLCELLNSLLVISQVLLATDQDNGETVAEVEDLGDPL
jgi:hypothetical protein